MHVKTSKASAIASLHYGKKQQFHIKIYLCFVENYYGNN